MKPPFQFVNWTHLPDDGVLEQLDQLHQQVFQAPLTAERLKARLQGFADPLIQLAYAQNKLVAFKIGYARKPRHYYSWLGGVDPAYRRQGLARELTIKQHAWCQSRGYQTLRTHSKNRWTGMLILNLKQGYEIIGTNLGRDGSLRIIFEKEL